jgi:hypothetical protein
MSGAYVTVDVVDLRRIERIAADFGPALERRLLHPLEREQLAAMEPPAKVRRLGAALATKEAWIKAQSGRPSGWTFDLAAFLPVAVCDRPGAVDSLVVEFVEDLGATSVEVGIVCEGAAGAHWAWHGLYEHWLISALLR